jgi:hypothetical protein
MQRKQGVVPSERRKLDTFSGLRDGRSMTSNAFEAAALESRILIALFELCRDNRRVTARTLAETAGTTATLAASCLLALERAGLCDASRARLTMVGLARAAQLAHGGSGGAHGKVRQLSERAAQSSRSLPIAALPSQPPGAPLPC